MREKQSVRRASRWETVVSRAALILTSASVLLSAFVGR